MCMRHGLVKLRTDMHTWPRQRQMSWHERTFKVQAPLLLNPSLLSTQDSVHKPPSTFCSMCKGPLQGSSPSVAEDSNKGEPGLFGTLFRVLSDFNNSAASTRADYYKVVASEELLSKRVKVPFGTEKQFSRVEVAKHSSMDDCWIIVKGKVYDVTDFAVKHPGGRVIYTYGGKDATDVFTAFHAGASWAKLAEVQIGRLEEADAAQPVDPIVADFRELRAKIAQEGALVVLKRLSRIPLTFPPPALLLSALGLVRGMDLNFLCLFLPPLTPPSPVDITYI